MRRRGQVAGGFVLTLQRAWRQVHAMLLEAVARTTELEREPSPHVLQAALSDFWVRLGNQPGRLECL